MSWMVERFGLTPYARICFGSEGADGGGSASPSSGLGSGNNPSNPSGHPSHGPVGSNPGNNGVGGGLGLGPGDSLADADLSLVQDPVEYGRLVGARLGAVVGHPQSVPAHLADLAAKMNDAVEDGALSEAEKSAFSQSIKTTTNAIAAKNIGIDPISGAIMDAGRLNAANTAGVRTTAILGRTTAIPGQRPIIIDLDDDGIELINIDQSAAFFDHDDDGFKENIGWLSGDDAFLIVDDNNDNLVTYNELIIADRTDEDDTDLEAFATLYDDNNDGIFNSLDSSFYLAKVWQDLDRRKTNLEGKILGLNMT